MDSDILAASFLHIQVLMNSSPLCFRSLLLPEYTFVNEAIYFGERVTGKSVHVIHMPTDRFGQHGSPPCLDGPSTLFIEHPWP